MAANAGVSYSIVPYGQANNTYVPWTDGDGSTTWPYIDNSRGPAIGVGTTESGIVVTSPGAHNVRGITSQNFNYGNPYQYCAIGFQEAGPGYLNTKAPGWVICEVEAVPGTSFPGNQSYIPIEGTDGMVTDNGTSTYLPGELPPWSSGVGGSLDMIVFFFDGYQTGDVDTWTVWDGTTTPDTYADWDSFASTGRFRVDMNSMTNVEILVSETTYSDPGGGEIGSGATADFLIYTTDAPAFAVWSVVNSTWVVSTRNPAADSGRLAYGDGSNQFVVNDFYYIVPLSIATPPVNPSTWRAYDGPAIRDYDEYMAADAGVGYWEVPFGQGETAYPGPRTGGDASTTWTTGMTVPTASGSATTKSGIVLPNITRRLSGPYNELNNPLVTVRATQLAGLFWKSSRLQE